jgi:hypothetical protein
MDPTNDQVDGTVPGVALAGRREWIGLAVLALACLLYAMDLTVLHLAVPSLSAELQPSSAQLLWITDIYGFMVAGFLITMGTLGDRIGRRRLLLVGATALRRSRSPSPSPSHSLSRPSRSSDRARAASPARASASPRRPKARPAFTPASTTDDDHHHGKGCPGRCLACSAPPGLLRVRRTGGHLATMPSTSPSLCSLARPSQTWTPSGATAR